MFLLMELNLTYLEAPNHLVWPLASLRAEHERIESLSFVQIAKQLAVETH